MLRWKNLFTMLIIAAIGFPAVAFTQNAKAPYPAGGAKIIIEKKAGNAAYKEELPPVLAITPREIDLGMIGPDETVSGMFSFKNRGSGILHWSTKGPEGWLAVEHQKISGKVEDEPDSLRIELHYLPQESQLEGIKPKGMLRTLEIKLEAYGEAMICRKEVTAGVHRDAIKVSSSGGQRTIFFNYKIVSGQESARLHLNPMRIDTGSHLAGKTVSKTIRLTNSGKEMLKWRVAAQKTKTMETSISARKGRYISFINEEIRGNGNYAAPGSLKESMELTGSWLEKDGYPLSPGGGNSIKYHFNGTGIIIYFTTYPDFGNLAIYIDERPVNSHEWVSEQTERGELPGAEDLEDGAHTLTIVNKEGRIELEGVKITGRDVMKGNPGWVTVIPDSGTTTQEIDYINIALNTASLAPGYYMDNVVFTSNGGDATVEVFMEILSDSQPKIVDVYRFVKGFDYLLTANPQAETKKLTQNGYAKEGIAFRLFGTDTPGTTAFYRWYNPQLKDHYYHHDSKGGGKSLQGYVFEGPIGNIATSKLTNTRPLYRWYRAKSGHNFYTTDAKGEAAAKKGYIFEGITGYVK